MELKRYLNPIRRWWWLILVATMVATASSVAAVRQQPNTYAARTILMVGRSMENPNPSNTDVWLSQQLAQTYAEIAKLPTVQQSTQEALGLGWLPEYTVSLVPNTQLLAIQVVDTNPQRAQVVADALAQQLIKQSPSASERERQERQQFVTRQLQDLEANIAETEARVQELQEQLADMFSARQIADTESQIAALEQKRTTYQANYASLLSFLEGGVNTLQVMQPATAPTTPIGPNRAMTILLAAAIGLLLALGAAYLLDYLDDTLKDPDDIREGLALNTLGAIMEIEGEQPADKLLTTLKGRDPAAEAYRVLRTNLQFAMLDNPPHTLLVTSANPAEGRTTTLANLGIVLAQQGQRVVLVDTDLRRPALHRMFHTPNTVGLMNALLQPEATATDFLQETGVPNLRLLTTGPLPPNPAELLGSTRFGEVRKQLEADADVVLFDSPPVLAVADSAILARQVDGVLMVVKAAVTRRPMAQKAQESLEQVGGQILGAALNQLRPHSNGYYYYYRYRDYSVEGEGQNARGGRSRSPKGWRRWLPGPLAGR